MAVPTRLAMAARLASLVRSCSTAGGVVAVCAMDDSVVDHTDVWGRKTGGSDQARGAPRVGVHAGGGPPERGAGSVGPVHPDLQIEPVVRDTGDSAAGGEF